MHKYVCQVQHIWRRWKPLASKSEKFEWEPHGIPVFRAQITIRTSALSMTKRQEKVGLCKLTSTPLHPILISKSISDVRYEKTCILHPRISSLAWQQGLMLGLQVPETWLKSWSAVKISGSVLVCFGKEVKML